MQSMKSLFLAAVLIVVIIAGGFFLYSKSGTVNSKVQNTTQNVTGAMQQNQNTKQIVLTSGGFSPETLNVKVGDLVTWINKSGTEAQVDSDPHPLHTSYPPMNFDQ